MKRYLRTTTFTSGQAGPGGCSPLSLLCVLVLVFVAPELRAETTLYVGKHFEVRDHDAPVKYVFNGNTRVARVTGSLSANERIQRLRLRAGWNLVSLAVTAPDLLEQLREFTSGPAPVIKALYRWRPATSDYGVITSGESVAAGTVLWMSAQVDAIVPVRGGYVDPTQWGVPVGETFVAVPALEAQPLRLPVGVTVWRYDAPNRRWQAGLTGNLASVSELPSTLAPGEAIFVHSTESTDLGAPAPEERIRYYHQDHLGSSSAMTDANGAIVEETAFYPFGIPRHEYRVRPIDEAYKFTQKERDQESGLHYFEARYLAGAMSRFLSGDPMYANTDSSSDDPQTLNLYAYVGNNPLQYTDPTGLDRYSDIANAAALSDSRAAADEGTTMGILQVGATITTGFCDFALGCGNGGYQVTRSIVVEAYNVDTDSTLYKGSAVAGFLTSLAVPVGGVVNGLRGGSRVAVAAAGEGGGIAAVRAGSTQAGASTMATGAGSVGGASGASAGVRAASANGVIRGGAARTAGGEVAGGGGVFARTGENAALADTAMTTGTQTANANISGAQNWYRGMVDATRPGREAMWRYQTTAQRADSLSVIEAFSQTLFFGPK